MTQIIRIKWQDLTNLTFTQCWVFLCCSGIVREQRTFARKELSSRLLQERNSSRTLMSALPKVSGTVPFLLKSGTNFRETCSRTVPERFPNNKGISNTAFASCIHNCNAENWTLLNFITICAFFGSSYY